MANLANNPLSKLFDIEFPEIKRSNWNNSYDKILTSDVGYVIPVHTDRILPNTRVRMDIDTASFANPTVAPLYGRFKVKYLAFWAPDRLYVPSMQDGSAFEPGNNVPYPTIDLVTAGVSIADSLFDTVEETNVTTNSWYVTASGTPYVPPTSLLEYLGLYPAYCQATDFTSIIGEGESAEFMPDTTVSRCAFPFLAYWDIYRNFILNVQEPSFPVRKRGYWPEMTAKGVSDSIPDEIIPARDIKDQLVTRVALDSFFDQVKRLPKNFLSNPINGLIELTFQMPVFSPKDLWQVNRLGFNSSDYNDFVLRDNYHYFLPVAPYAPDNYSSWISNQNVQLERSKSTVLVNNNQFTMEQWKIASRIQNIYRKSLFKQNDFAEFMDVQFGVRPSTGITKPMFLGAFVSDIIFKDVVSSAQTGSGENISSNDALGSRAGYGVGRDTDRSNFIDFTSKEPGTLMILQIITPEVFYFEGTDLKFFHTNYRTEFNPEFDAIGYQDLQKAQMNMCPNLSEDIFGRSSGAFGSYDSYNAAIAQQPYAMEYMAMPNTLAGMMTMPNYYQRWSLARSFNYNRGDNSLVTSARGLYSTYIYPEMYNNIFQNTSGIDNFQFYLHFDYQKYQPISKQFLSFN